MTKIATVEQDEVLPSYIMDAFGDAALNDDLMGGVNTGFPVLSYKGKTWAVNEGDNRTILTRPDDEDTPASYIDVVIVKANRNLSKVYYPNGYEEGTNLKPVCYSNDGIAPAQDAQDPQAPKCLGCPHNMWGSRITDNGSKGKACADSRRVCLVPVGELNRPMLLRIPACSLNDLSAYAELLQRRKVPYAAVVTRIGFDKEVAYPKLTFKTLRLLKQDEIMQIKELLTKDIVDQILGVPRQTSAEAPAAAVPAVPQTKASVGVKEVEQVIAKPAEKKQTKLVVMDDVEEALEPAPEPKPKKKSNKADALLADAKDELEKALSEHFDD